MVFVARHVIGSRPIKLCNLYRGITITFDCARAQAKSHCSSLKYARRKRGMPCIGSSWFFAFGKQNHEIGLSCHILLKIYLYTYFATFQIQTKHYERNAKLFPHKRRRRVFKKTYLSELTGLCLQIIRCTAKPVILLTKPEYGRFATAIIPVTNTWWSKWWQTTLCTGVRQQGHPSLSLASTHGEMCISWCHCVIAIRPRPSFMELLSTKSSWAQQQNCLPE